MLKFVDTHQHLVYPDRVGYAWTDGIPPLANQAFTLDDYHALTNGNAGGAHIGETIFMEAGVDDTDFQTETRFISSLATDPANKISGIIASCRPETDDGFDAWLDECTNMPVVGFRRILHVMPDDLSQSETFRNNVRKIGARGLTFDMCVLPNQLPIAKELAKACDNTPFILNHCGVPDIAGNGLDPWRQYLSDLASCPNVSCKISGVLAYCAPGTASLETIRPYLEHACEAFGPDRLVWGSDWPVVNLAHGIEDWIAVTSDFAVGFSSDEANKLAHSNARRIYNL